MINDQELTDMLKINQKIDYKLSANLKRYNTWKVGGELSFLLNINNISELEEAISILKSAKRPFFILGKGSNTLFPDGYVDAVGIKLLGDFAALDINQDEVNVGAGAPMVSLAMKTANEKLSGLEFASGIPGSVGGSIVMNAGANGSEICDVLVEVTVLDKNGDIRKLKRSELNFSYRHSDFMDNEMIILSSKFKLKEDVDGKAKERIAKIKEYRFRTQPYDMPCAGSVFKNPTGDYAGRIIEELGLKGKSVGGASVSEKHANFIVNNGTATAMDIRILIDDIQNIVFENKKIRLEREVRYFGQEDLLNWK